MPRRPSNSTTEKQSDQVELDAFHGAVVDGVCASDSGRAAAGELIWLRTATAHEFCMPDGPCWTWPAWVLVRAIAPGIRLREPLAANWAVAS